MFKTRRSGILLHPTSLPSLLGVGDFGAEAYAFVDKLKEANQTLWQILPLCPVDYSGSPYQSTSAFAGEPLLVSLSLLAKEGLLSQEAVDMAAGETSLPHVDYAMAREKKYPLFKKAFDAFRALPPSEEYTAFCKENLFWLEEYALFTAVKEHFQKERAGDEEGAEAFAQSVEGILSEELAKAYYLSACWCSFPESLKKRNPQSVKKWKNMLAQENDMIYFLQFMFHKQWQALKAYANENGVDIIGDVPIFVAYDSADVWGNQKLFTLNKNGFPDTVAGVPPDYFSETGQLWGNPLYHWKQHAKTNYTWWMQRMQKEMRNADILRLDHFRGFETYWEIPFGAEDARSGQWVKGPGVELFRALEQKLGNLPFIAEDLGEITDEVRALRAELGLPGMRILQFAFGNDKNNAYLPHCYEKDTVVYTGTHDNDTTQGWYATATEEEKDHFRRYLNVSGDSPAWDLIRLAFSSPAQVAMVPLQDVLNLPATYRMNMPGTVRGNWTFAFRWDMWKKSNTQGLAYLSRLFGRNQG